jgi:hypothetical protein
MSTENVAFMRLGQIETGAQRLERERRDLELRAAMVGVIADARRSAPLDRPGFAPPAQAPGSRNGWRTAPPLEMPGGDRSQRIIEQLCDAMLGPGAPAALGRGPGATAPKAELEAAKPEVAHVAVAVAEPVAPRAKAVTDAPPAAAEVTRRRLT